MTIKHLSKRRAAVAAVVVGAAGFGLTSLGGGTPSLAASARTAGPVASSVEAGADIPSTGVLRGINGWRGWGFTARRAGHAINLAADTYTGATDGTMFIVAGGPAPQSQHSIRVSVPHKVSVTLPSYTGGRLPSTSGPSVSAGHGPTVDPGWQTTADLGTLPSASVAPVDTGRVGTVHGPDVDVD
jgi:hypothetical protein